MTARIRIIGLWAGPLVYLVLSLVEGSELPTDASKALSVAAWMLIWWLTEAVPMAAAALLPLVLFPFNGLMTMEEAAAPYGSKFVFLFLGGFLVALALEKWQLHKRIALNIVLATGSSLNRVLLGFMLATAFISMWISNTATTLMMLPIATSVIVLFKHSIGNEDHQKRFAVLMMLGIAYAANIGGMATLVGTPPNAAMAGILADNFGIHVSFAGWMAIAFPFSLVLLFVVFGVMRMMHRLPSEQLAGGKQLILDERAQLGQMSEGERRVMWVFLATAGLWMFKDLLINVPGLQFLNDTSIAIAGGIALFVIPSAKGGERLLLWDDTKHLPWGILLLFGGGLVLADAFKKSGLLSSVVAVLGDWGMPLLVLMTVLVVLALFITEVMSNLALVVLMLPVVAQLAAEMGLDPLLFAIPVTLASSCAFMLPMATPPNAIVFAGGYVTIPQMARTGLILNLLSALILTVLCYLFL